MAMAILGAQWVEIQQIKSCHKGGQESRKWDMNMNQSKLDLIYQWKDRKIGCSGPEKIIQGHSEVLWLGGE